MNLNSNLLYAGISLIFAVIIALDNQVSGDAKKLGYYVRVAILNFVALYFINPLMFLNSNVSVPQFNTGISPF